MPQPPLRLTTRIHPSPAQHARLQLMWDTLLAAQSALTTWLYHHAGGGTHSLLTTASRQAGSLPVTTPRPLRSLPTLTQIEDEVRYARDALGWAQVLPASALRWMAAETAREWRGCPHGPLPGPWPQDRAPELHLGNAVQLRDAVTLQVAPLSPNELVTADLYLPGPYWTALLRRQRRRQDHEHARHDVLERAWLDDRDRGAAKELLARRARGGPWAEWSWPDLPEPLPGEPISRERTVLRWVAGNGLPGRWVAEWAFSAGDGVAPRWVIDDVLGVDIGYHHPFACASGTLNTLTPRPFQGSFAPPGLSGHAFFHGAWARARHRRAMFLRLLPLFETQLDLALQHRAVATEQVAWGGFAQRGFPFTSYALDVGLVAWLTWLDALAPQHGVRILRVPPAYTTRTCSACMRLGPRPASGQPFCCVGCGHTSQADLNAARVIRRRGLALLGRP
ncbi:zinc ribbon domain-containing protein [Deinococcus sp. AJ005]|uniref:zinc ribbon domain-containing protein n=1 Tax=Deinococcus sp. AJ005 TaxID=2652443 RepID=UPI00125CAC1F|nr:zinc ribbon domain-containing protein [Deinococcus sp. AJ005]QFP75022.1 transposase [Deinococcus sp. AJ005]